MAVWKLKIDWDRNGDFTGLYDDVSTRTIQCNWFLGMRKPYQETADNSLAVLILNNVDRRFSPDNAASPLFGKVVPQRPIQITSFDGVTERVHWVGWIEAVQPKVNARGQRIVKILANGAMQFYKAAETQLTLQENKRTDEIIAELLTEVMLPPALNRAWVMGRTGNTEVGSTTYLADTTAYSDLEPGRLTLGMAADNWVVDGGSANAGKNTFDVYSAIGDITSAEHGRFFFNREGKAVFWNRHHLLQGGVPEATFDNSMTDMTYSFAGLEECKNEIIVICHPRTIGTNAESVLWELGSSVITVEVGKPRTIYIKYEDENGKRVGAREVTVDDLEMSIGSATVSVTEKANGAELTFTALGDQSAVVVKCVLKGRKIVDAGDIEAKATDQMSMIDYGRRTMRINLPSIDSIEHAQYIADFERDRRGKPQGMVQSLSVVAIEPAGSERQQQMLNLTIGSLIQVNEMQTGHSAQYYIIAEAHEISHGGMLWKTTWYLEPAPQRYPWKLGVTGRSELGAVTHVTY